jgi:molybdopterin synthase sulfur carrier subunit
MPSVRIPTPLRRLTGDKDEVTINAKDIRELIEGLEKQFPGVKERLCDESGNVRRFINLYVNNEDIRFLKGIETELKESDIVSIIPAIAGGLETKHRITRKDIQISSISSAKTSISKSNKHYAKNHNKIL